MHTVCCGALTSGLAHDTSVAADRGGLEGRSHTEDGKKNSDNTHDYMFDLREVLEEKERW